MKFYKIYWLDGKVEIVEGETVDKAFSSAGYGSGAIRALDWYEEVKEFPLEEKLLCMEEGYEIPNKRFIEQIKQQSHYSVGNEILVNLYNRLFNLTVVKIDAYRIYFRQTSCETKSEDVYEKI